MYTILSSSMVTKFLAEEKNSNFDTVLWFPLQNKACVSRSRVYVHKMTKYDLVTTDMYNNVHIKTRKKLGEKAFK